MKTRYGRARYGRSHYGRTPILITFTLYGRAHYGTSHYGISYNIPFLLKKVYFLARGQVGKMMIYRYNGSQGRQDAYDYVLGRNPQTDAQQANRLKFKAAMQAWAALSTDGKAIYEHRAKGRGLYGKNIFVKEFMLDII